MNADLNKYVKLQTALINEKAKLEARLTAINQVLGQGASAHAPSPAVPATTTTPGKRTFSAATKAKMAAAQKARWAKKKGVVESAVAPAATKKAKRTMSEATKAKMRAAHQARWAKKKGATVATDAAVPSTAPKKKRKMSAAGRAAIVAAAKARWAKAKAAGKKTLGG